MSVSQRTLDLIREKIPLVDYFGDLAPHKEGSRFVLCCPFHTNSGKNRALTIFPDGNWHCFSCKAHGDLFDACILREGVEFPEAIERLAKRAGITIEYLGKDKSEKATVERSLRGAAFAAAEWATTWMQQQLKDNAVATGYLRVDRKLPTDIIDRWRLGWAPGDRMIAAANDAGHVIEALMAAGLVVEKDDGLRRSFFYERIVIPITNANGKVVAWTARALPDALKSAAQAGRHLPKYINPGENLIYSKRRAILGLRAAHPNLSRNQALIVVEGALDVLALDCLGVPVATCTCGVALSDDQASSLIDVAKHAEVPIVLLYDGDGAGSEASRKNAEMLFTLGGRARVAMLPAEITDADGTKHKVKDCGDLWERAGAAGGEHIRTAITASKPSWDYLVERACPAVGAMDLDSRLIAADKLLAIANRIEDEERRDLAIAQVGERLDITRAQLVRRSDRQREEVTRKAPAGSDPQSAGKATEGDWGFIIPPADTEALIPPGKERDFELNELGNALRFAAYYGTRVRYVATWGSWIVWTGTNWKGDNSGQVQRWMMDAIDQSCRAEQTRAWDKTRSAPKNSRDVADWTQRAIELERWRIKNLNARSKGNSIDVAQALRCLVTTSDQLDADPFLFACKNGWVDLRTGILTPHDAAKLYTRACPIAFDPEARDPRFESFLSESMNQNASVLGFLRRFAGYSATGDTGEQAVLMIAGPGGNGKSLFTRCLQSILGGYAYSADFAIFLASHGDKRKWTLANLEKSRLVVCEESGEGRRFSSDLVKNVTGGTPIEAEAKGRQPFTYNPQFKVMFVTNHPPRVSDRDHAFWRRMKLVRFDYIPKNPDKHLATHLLTTQSAQQAILAWIVAGAQEWHKEGLQTPIEIDQANLQYRDEQNPLRDYLAERTTWADTLEACGREPSQEVVAKATLRLDYMDWSKSNGVEPISSRQFAERLRELGATEDVNAYNADRDRTERAWGGLRLRLAEIDDRAPIVPGGPWTYAKPATPDAPQHFVPDTNPSRSGEINTYPGVTDPSGIASESGTNCYDIPGVTTQPTVSTGANVLTSSPAHVSQRDGDADNATHDTDNIHDASRARAPITPICYDVSSEEKGSHVGTPSEGSPPTRADKLRQPPSASEDLFNKSADRQPGDDEDEPPWDPAWGAQGPPPT